MGAQVALVFAQQASDNGVTLSVDGVLEVAAADNQLRVDLERVKQVGCLRACIPTTAAARGRGWDVRVCARDVCSWWDFVLPPQVLTNLTSNAIKYSSTGATVRVTVRLDSVAPGGAVAGIGRTLLVDGRALADTPYVRIDGSAGGEAASETFKWLHFAVMVRCVFSPSVWPSAHARARSLLFVRAGYWRRRVRVGPRAPFGDVLSGAGG